MKKFLYLLFFFVFIFSVVACEDGETKSCGDARGICASGFQICIDGEWSGCSIIPNNEDICGNYLDDDCDGVVDENCICVEGETEECGFGIGICVKGERMCTGGEWSDCCINGDFSNCVAPPGPGNESCEDLLDNDCDGKTDCDDDDCFRHANCTIVNPCNDGIKNFDEQGIDCGGAYCDSCPSCTNGKLDEEFDEDKVSVIIDERGTRSDCSNNESSPCPVCPSCSDDIKNQAEEGVDCGGPCAVCEPTDDSDGVDYYEDEVDCNYDGVCDTFEDEESCPEDCSGRWGFFLVLFIIIVILFVVFLFFLNRMLKKKKKPKEQPIRIHSFLLREAERRGFKPDELTKELKKIK